MANYHALQKAYAPHVEVGESSLVPIENTPERLMVVVLKDQDGYVQAIFRRKDLLDIEMLNLEYGRQLKAVAPNTLTALRRRLGLKVMQPWPMPEGNWTTVWDSGIMGLSHVDIPVDDESMVRIQTSEFLEVIKSADRKKVTRSLDGICLTCDQGNVEACISEFTKLKIKRSLDETIELPPLSTSARKLMDLRADPNANLLDLVAIIENDPSLTASILRWSKSSFYTNAREIRDVKDAVGRVMGFDLVMNLAMGLTLGGVINKPQDSPEGFMEYWQQAIWMSQIMAAVSSCIPSDRRPPVGISYLLGILHNFGYLILNHVFPGFFTLICRSWEANRHLDPSIVEKKILGITREEIAAELFECWDMPYALISGIRYQKDPDFNGEHSEYILLMNACRSLMAEMGLPLGYELPASSVYLKRLGVKGELLAARLDTLVENRDRIDSMAALL